MLSIGAMGGGQSGYYVGLAREDYYQAGGEPPGVWHGKGAKDLGLTDRWTVRRSLACSRAFIPGMTAP